MKKKTKAWTEYSIERPNSIGSNSELVSLLSTAQHKVISSTLQTFLFYIFVISRKEKKTAFGKALWKNSLLKYLKFEYQKKWLKNLCDYWKKKSTC